jgi:hypothetical protein
MALTQYEHWKVYYITNSKLDEINALTNSANSNKFMEKLLEACRENIGDLSSQCSIFPAGGNYTIADVLPHYDHEGRGFVFTFVAIDTQIKLPVGLLSIITKVGADIIFTHPLGYQAIGCYISWTCSFTKSRKMTNMGVTIRDYYRVQADHYRLTISKYITDYVGEWLLRQYDGLQYVIFYSIGIEQSRESHRKHGKLSACKFVESWVNESGQTLPMAYNEPPFSNMMYYFYISGGEAFIGSEIYDSFVQNNGNISRQNIQDENHPWADINYQCPSGPVNDDAVRAEYTAKGWIGGKGTRRRRNRSRRRSRAKK